MAETEVKPLPASKQFVLHTGSHIGWCPAYKNSNHVYASGSVVPQFANTDGVIVDLAASYPEKFSYPGAVGGGVVAETPELLAAQIEELTTKLTAMKAGQAATGAGAAQLDAGALAAIDQMDVDQLKAFAAEEEVSLAGFHPKNPRAHAQTRKELATFIKAALGAAKTAGVEVSDDDGE